MCICQYRTRVLEQVLPEHPQTLQISKTHLPSNRVPYIFLFLQLHSLPFCFPLLGTIPCQPSTHCNGQAACPLFSVNPSWRDSGCSARQGPLGAVTCSNSSSGSVGGRPAASGRAQEPGGESRGGGVRRGAT